MDRLGARSRLSGSVTFAHACACENGCETESGDLREFLREIALRHERIWREESKALREMVLELRALREENGEDHRAQTQALFHVLDRLENGGAAG